MPALRATPPLAAMSTAPCADMCESWPKRTHSQFDTFASAAIRGFASPRDGRLPFLRLPSGPPPRGGRCLALRAPGRRGDSPARPRRVDRSEGVHGAARRTAPRSGISR